jgi:hypothetical protein
MLPMQGLGSTIVLKKEVKSNSGEMQECIFEVTTYDTVFQIGKSIMINVKCDNSRCDKPVRLFNIEIERGFKMEFEEVAFNVEIVLSKSFTGIAAHSSHENMMMIEVPELDTTDHAGTVLSR